MRLVLHATCGERFLSKVGRWLCKSNGQAVIALLQLSLHVSKGRLHSLALLHACLHVQRLALVWPIFLRRQKYGSTNTTASL